MGSYPADAGVEQEKFSSTERVARLSGCEELQIIFERKKIRWAASVYGRHLPALRITAERILKTAYKGHNIKWQWLDEEVPLSQRGEVKVKEWDEASTQEYSDGSRVGGAAAAETTRDAYYLGSHGTVMDAEMLGINMALSRQDTPRLHSTVKGQSAGQHSCTPNPRDRGLNCNCKRHVRQAAP